MFDLVLLGVGLLIAGLLVVFLATVVASREGKERGEVRAGGGAVVMIGPIPIVFGSSPKWAVLVMLLAIVLILLGFLLSQGA